MVGIQQILQDKLIDSNDELLSYFEQATWYIHFFPFHVASGYSCALGRIVHVCSVSCPMIQATLYCQNPETDGAIVCGHSPQSSVGNRGSQMLPEIEVMQFLPAHHVNLP